MVYNVAEQAFHVSTLWVAELWKHHGGDGNTGVSFLLGLFAIIALSSPLPGGGDFGMSGLDIVFVQARGSGALKMASTNKSMMTNRRFPTAHGAKQNFGRAVHAPPLLPASVAYLFR